VAAGDWKGLERMGRERQYWKGVDWIGMEGTGLEWQ